MSNVQEVLEELRGLLDSRVVECPGCFAAGCPKWIGAAGYYRISGLPAWHEPFKAGCKATGKVSDPDYDPLREVVREKCPGNPGSPGRACKGNDEDGEYEHTLCDGTGRIPRSFEGWLDGQLEGALYKALKPLVPPMNDDEADDWEPIRKARLTILILLGEEGDTRLAAARALLEALKGQA
ncbi:hypothetical protein LCGC14_0757520 [marine sediment metagenome]|uniref:Uncharacterized protein n=1 Tax=marine sediment metagenome TaxID=412755 RepID=A0A0F9Q278_9ZZZZ